MYKEFTIAHSKYYLTAGYFYTFYELKIIYLIFSTWGHENGEEKGSTLSWERERHSRKRENKRLECKHGVFWVWQGWEDMKDAWMYEDGLGYAAVTNSPNISVA